MGNYKDLGTSEKGRSNWRSFRPVVLCILIFELCERLTYYSITANFVRFNTIYLEVDNITAINISNIFTGVMFVLCVVSGCISDSVLGKFRTIVWSGLVYLGGVTLLTIVTFDIGKYWDINHELTTTDKRVFSAFGLLLLALGTGGIKTTVGPFGAEQFKTNKEDITRLYYLWLYWFINIGSAIAFLLVTYIQQNISFFTGFLIPFGFICVANLLFVIPNRFYVKNSPIMENNIFTSVKIVLVSLQKRSKAIYKYTNLLDYSRLSNGGSYEDQTINDLIRVKRIIPVLLTFIPFFISYFQMQSTYLLQGERLYLNISTFKIPVASLSVVNSVVIIFIIPLLAILVYPLIIKCLGKSPTPLQRIGFGLFLSGVSVLIAGVLEVVRKNDLHKYGGIEQTVFDKTYNVSSISVAAQIPQFLFVAVGEVFASATGLEFAYSQAPVSQRGIITGLFYLMMGLGSFASSLLILIVNINSEKPWMPSDIDMGNYENFYFLLTGIIFVDVIIFIFIARSYKYVDRAEEKTFIAKYSNSTESGKVVFYDS